MPSGSSSPGVNATTTCLDSPGNKAKVEVGATTSSWAMFGACTTASNTAVTPMFVTDNSKSCFFPLCTEPEREPLTAKVATSGSIQHLDGAPRSTGYGSQCKVSRTFLIWFQGCGVFHLEAQHGWWDIAVSHRQIGQNERAVVVDEQRNYYRTGVGNQRNHSQPAHDDVNYGWRRWRWRRRWRKLCDAAEFKQDLSCTIVGMRKRRVLVCQGELAIKLYEGCHVLVVHARFELLRTIDVASIANLQDIGTR
eukprot:scaffold845_cov364-Prasinococcus_capsulatus_cf.AAC.7